MSGARWIGMFTTAVLLLGTGCSERLLRENVFANTETGIGLFVNQNRQTQLYEGKLGYFRHELFLVPTNKVIDGEPNDPVSMFGPMDVTPEVLADIEGSAGFGQADGKRASIRQRLAVGRIAVQAPAAVALMAEDADVAAAIAQQMIGSGLPPSEMRHAYDLVANVYGQLEELKDAGDNTAANHVGQLDLVGQRLLTNERRAFDHYEFDVSTTPSILTLRPVMTAPGADANYERFTTATLRLRQMRDSQLALKAALNEISQGTAVNFQDRTPAGAASPPAASAVDAQKAAQLSADYIALRDEFQGFDTQLRSDPQVRAAVEYYQSLWREER